MTGGSRQRLLDTASFCEALALLGSLEQRVRFVLYELPGVADRSRGHRARAEDRFVQGNRVSVTMSASPASDTDDILVPFLNAADEASAQELLGELITEHAEPIARNIIRSRLVGSSREASGRDWQESEDVRAEVTLQLIKHLRDIRNLACNPVADFSAYVAVVTYHACDRYLRQKYPARHILRTKMRYLLTHHPSFMMWGGQGREFYCGVARPRAAVDDNVRVRSLKDLRDNPAELAAARLETVDLGNIEIAYLVGAIFRWAVAPVEFEDLVKTVWTLTGIESQAGQPESLEGVRRPLEETVADSRVNVAAEVDRRAAFERLWREICELPPRQRAVLLLNLRDGDDRSVTSLLPLTGVCDFKQIAAAVSMNAEELARIWNELPLADAVVAERMGIKRQQVINLRKSARERLARRMRDFL